MREISEMALIAFLVGTWTRIAHGIQVVDGDGLKRLDNPVEADLMCPFVYSEYELTIGKFDFKFAPEDYGLSGGFYCSMNFSSEGVQIGTTFDNCACPFGRNCVQDQSFDDDLLGNVLLGRCAVQKWVLVGPLLAIGLFISCGMVHFFIKRDRVLVIRSPRSLRRLRFVPPEQASRENANPTQSSHRRDESEHHYVSLD